MNDLHQKLTVQRLSAALIAFFVLAGLSVLVVYFADPTIYTKVLMLDSAPSDRYPLPATLFLIALLLFITVVIIGVMRHWRWLFWLLIALLLFITVVIIGVMRHWRWLFWLLLVANSFSILEVPATILQLNGVIADPYPAWYSLYRMGIALIQVGIGIWMIRVLYHDGVWGMGRKKHEKLPSHI